MEDMPITGPWESFRRYFHPLPLSRVVADYNKTCRQIRENVCNFKYDPKMLFVLLLNTAQLEFILKEVLTGGAVG
jgi:hypothetical protein